MFQVSEVRRRLLGSIQDTDLRAYLEALRASGEWTVFPPFSTSQGWIMQLFHHLTGTTLTIRAECVDVTTWRLGP